MAGVLNCCSAAVRAACNLGIAVRAHIKRRVAHGELHASLNLCTNVPARDFLQAVDPDCCSKRLPSSSGPGKQGVSLPMSPIFVAYDLARAGGRDRLYRIRGDGLRVGQPPTMRATGSTSAPRSPTSGVGIVWRVARAQGVPNDILVRSTRAVLPLVTCWKLCFCI
jgi:hypothetical protein